jgi:hypothetical protein
MTFLTWTAILWAATGPLPAQNDKAQANSYDDAWESAWVSHCRSVYRTDGKTAGFVLQVGDSITHSNPYSQWPRYGAGRTAEDLAIVSWCRADVPFSSTQNDTSNKNGWYLTAADTSGWRGMTSAGGLRTDEFLTGSGNGATPMPATTDPATARAYVADGTTYIADLNATTVAAAFLDAQFAVLMLGTNDAGGGRAAADYLRDLTSIVDIFEGRNIVVILSTLPPRQGAETLIDAYNAQIRDLARTRGLPLIDYYAEILARRPGTSWQGTLISSDGIHPNATGSANDPYTPGGDPSVHRTGDNAMNDGYLLRSWLTIQKLKEVKSYVADGNDPPSPPEPEPEPSPSPGPGPGRTLGDDNDSNDAPCGCGSVRAGLPGAVWIGGLLLGILLACAGRRA